MTHVESNAEVARREALAKGRGLFVEGDDVMPDVRLGGQIIGHVMQGANDEWYPVSLNKASWADPLEGRDNIRGTGYRSQLSAAVALTDLDSSPSSAP